MLLTEGFDFQRLRSSDNKWRGPDVGLKVDLTRLKTQDGRTLASTVGQKPIMISTVDPNCNLCRTASDEMVQLRDELQPGIGLKMSVAASIAATLFSESGSC